MSTTKNAVVRAIVSGILTDLMVKTNAENVFVDETTTLADKLATIVADINDRAKSTDVTAEITQAISDLIGGAPETYNTLKEISDYISEHQGVVDTLNAAIGNKADKSVVDTIQTTLSGILTDVEGLNTAIDALGALANKDQVAESDLDSALADKINKTDSGGAPFDAEVLNYPELDFDTDIPLGEVCYINTNMASIAMNIPPIPGSDKSGYALSFSTDGYSNQIQVYIPIYAKSMYIRWYRDKAHAWSEWVNMLEGGSGDSHTHENKVVLDAITQEKLIEWDSKSTVFVSATEPAEMAEGDLLIQITE